MVGIDSTVNHVLQSHMRKLAMLIDFGCQDRCSTKVRTIRTTRIIYLRPGSIGRAGHLAAFNSPCIASRPKPNAPTCLSTAVCDYPACRQPSFPLSLQQHGSSSTIIAARRVSTRVLFARRVSILLGGADAERRQHDSSATPRRSPSCGRLPA